MRTTGISTCIAHCCPALATQAINARTPLFLTSLDQPQ
jgi:hypothetical protein